MQENTVAQEQLKPIEFNEFHLLSPRVVIEMIKNLVEQQYLTQAQSLVPLLGAFVKEDRFGTQQNLIGNTLLDFAVNRKKRQGVSQEESAWCDQLYPYFKQKAWDVLTGKSTDDSAVLENVIIKKYLEKEKASANAANSKLGSINTATDSFLRYGLYLSDKKVSVSEFLEQLNESIQLGIYPYDIFNETDGALTSLIEKTKLTETFGAHGSTGGYQSAGNSKTLLSLLILGSSSGQLNDLLRLPGMQGVCYSMLFGRMEKMSKISVQGLGSDPKVNSKQLDLALDGKMVSKDYHHITPLKGYMKIKEKAFENQSRNPLQHWNNVDREMMEPKVLSAYFTSHVKALCEKESVLVENALAFRSKWVHEMQANEVLSKEIKTQKSYYEKGLDDQLMHQELPREYIKSLLLSNEPVVSHWVEQTFKIDTKQWLLNLIEGAKSATEMVSRLVLVDDVQTLSYLNEHSPFVKNALLGLKSYGVVNPLWYMIKHGSVETLDWVMNQWGNDEQNSRIIDSWLEQADWVISEGHVRKKGDALAYTVAQGEIESLKIILKARPEISLKAAQKTYDYLKQVVNAGRVESKKANPLISAFELVLFERSIEKLHIEQPEVQEPVQRKTMSL